MMLALRVEANHFWASTGCLLQTEKTSYLKGVVADTIKTAPSEKEQISRLKRKFRHVQASHSEVLRSWNKVNYTSRTF